MAPVRSWCRLLLVALATWHSGSLAESAADYFIHHLPGAPEGPLLKMHAGLIEVDPDHHGNLFFWHFQNEHIANRQRTVIWLNGGPGCSSEDGALMEIGPYRVKDPNTLVRNDGSWNEFANLLFVDNPVGTGFSTIDSDSYVKELGEMATEFVTFLEKWFALFPEYEHDDIYLAGESYAGQHIPYIAREILERNKKAGIVRTWDLKGLLIGNGWISPEEQYESYLDFAYQKGLLEKGGEISQSLEQQWRLCKRLVSVGGELKIDYPDCEAILQGVLSQTKTMNGKDSECYNMYDVRLRDTFPSCGMNWPPDLAQMQPYLRRREVVDALHVTANKVQGWVECNGAVSAAFRARDSKPSITFLPELLAEIPILLFSGAEDLICNHIGTEKFLANMEWNGGKGFEIAPGNWAPRRDWTFDGEPAGFWQEARNLTYVLFYNASHMVPFDYPRRTRDMLDRFMGVDINSIGGKPADSRLDGEAGPDTSVGGDGGQRRPSEEDQQKLDDATWQAYERSGEVVLVIVAVAAAAWGYFVWRGRRRRVRRGYQGLSTDAGLPLGGDVAARGAGLGGFRGRRRSGGDVEAGDFDENRLDRLHVASPTDDIDERYSVGGVSDDEVNGDDGPESEKKRLSGNGQNS